MPIYLASVAASTAIVGYDVFTGLVWSRAPQDRTLEAIGVKGSAAGADTELEIYVDEVRVGNFFNITTGVPNNDDLLELESLFVPGGAQLRCLVKDAPATNPINVLVSLEDV